MLFYCYVLPLVLLVSLKMDNEVQRCLHVNSILDQNLDSFTRTGALEKLKTGVWSSAYLQTIMHLPSHQLTARDISEFTSGIEINIARVLIFLVDPSKVQFPDEVKWHVLEQEKDLLYYRHLNINAIVVNRQRQT